MNTKGTIAAVLAAAAAGVVAGILIAPAKGSETRQKIADTAENLKRKLRNLRKSTNDELNDLHDIFEHEVSGLKDDVREKVLRLIEASKKSYNNVKDEAMSN
ncbi:MAG: YtxH domain-containing protein [Bacteroidetes bacterium]|nr:YtxH domain-containing protein [Bacteroidota bacterium]